jgi:plastocyanin domain-containing protein
MKALGIAALALALTGCQKQEEAPPSKTPTVAAAPDGPQTIDLTVTEKGFEPSPIKVKANQPLTLRITRKTDQTCATEIVIPGESINTPLPLDKTVTVAFTPKKAGELKYGCAMDQMISGVLLVE